VTSKEEYLKNKEWFKRYDQSPKGKARHKKYDLNHKEQKRAYLRKHLKSIRKEILELLGNKCNNPDCPIPREKLNKMALVIDHINNDGYKQRRKGSNLMYYVRILREIKAGSKDYQCLCIYCNWIKYKRSRE